MPLFLRNCRLATVFRLSVCLKSNSARVQSNSFLFVQNLLFGWSKRVSASSAPLFWRDNFLSVHRHQCMWKQVYPVLRKLRFVPFQDFGRMFAMSGHFLFPIHLLSQTFLSTISLFPCATIIAICSAIAVRELRRDCTSTLRASE